MQFKIYSKPNNSCPYCVKAKKLLDSMNLPYEEIVLQSASELPQGNTFPAIFTDNGEFVGGYDDLVTRLI